MAPPVGNSGVTWQSQKTACLILPPFWTLYDYSSYTISWVSLCARQYMRHVLVLNATLVQFSSVQSLSHVWLFATPWTVACQVSLSITNSWSSPKPMSIESVMPSSHLILCHPLLLLSLIFLSIRVFSESVLRIRCPKYWSFSFSITPSNEHPGLISFRMDWLYLLAVQGTLKSLLQHHKFKSINSQPFGSNSHICSWLLEQL